MTTRFRSRHLHATLVRYTTTHLDALGWKTPPINFATTAITVTDYLPDDRVGAIAPNTVAVSLGDFIRDDEEELGAALGGGVRSAPYQVFIDVYMAEQALSHAICDDIRDIYTDATIMLVDQVTGLDVPGSPIEIESVLGPERPSQVLGAEQFKKYWRTMRLDTRLYFQT